MQSAFKTKITDFLAYVYQLWRAACNGYQMPIMSLQRPIAV